MKMKLLLSCFRSGYLLLLLGMFFHLSAFSQESLKVSGAVTDSLGNSLPGVSVSILNTEVGTITNSEGNYTLYAPANSVLVFSYVGFHNQEIPLEGRTNLSVKLRESDVGLEAVVVVGYGTVKKENLTGSVSQIKSESLEERAISTLSEAFAGQLAGVQARQPSGMPGRELDIKIRGTHTINASNEPLYVIDGVPGNIVDVNQNDIASIEVLKDASSAAIYGARGANGVVLVTTKKGKPGKPVFNFKALTGLQSPAKVVEMMDKDEFLAFNIWGKNESYLRKGGDLSDPMSARPAADQYPETWLNPSTLPNVNWAEKVYQTAPMQQYTLSMSGGSEKYGTHYLSGSYIKDEGIMKETGYNRLNLRLNSEINVGPRIKLGMQVAPSFSLKYAPNVDGADNIAMLSLAMPSIASLQSQTKKYGFTPGVFSFFNPIERLKQIQQKDRTNRTVASIWGEVQLNDQLSFRSLVGYNHVAFRTSDFVPSDVTTGEAFGGFNQTNLTTHSLQNTLTYTPELKNWLDMSVMLGQSIEGEISRNATGGGTGYPFDLVPTLNVAATTTGYSFDTEHRMASFFGRLNANIQDKYLFTANVRRDGSSRFGRDSKWGWFPSASVGWKIDRERFFEDVSWVDLLKLRASIGKVGNNSIGNYESISRLGATVYDLNGVIIKGMSPISSANPDLRWETKVSRNFGLDLGLFNNRLQLNLDYYIEDTRDMLLNVPVTHMYGFSSIRQNYGEMQNRGWEVDLTSNNINREFKWSTQLNFSRNRNKVTRLGADNAPIIIGTYGYTAFITKVGEPVGSFYMYKTDGLLLEDDFDAEGNPIVPTLAGQEMGNTKIVDVNQDGVINSGDHTVLGNNQPDFMWGMTNRFSYKNFDLNIFFQGSQGGKLFFLGSRHLDVGQIQGMNQFDRWVTSWKPERSDEQNPFPEHMDVDLSWDGKTPNRFGNNGLYNDTWLYDASFIRLRNVSLGYTFPKGFGRRIGIENFKVFLVGDNLFTWTDYKGYSPEAGNTKNGNETTMQGIDYGSYSTARIFSLGINLTF